METKCSAQEVMNELKISYDELKKFMNDVDVLQGCLSFSPKEGAIIEGTTKEQIIELYPIWKQGFKNINEINEVKKRRKRLQEELQNIWITSGFSFDGYTITKYSGYISGDDAISVDRGFDGLFSKGANVGEHLLASLKEIRRNALLELKEAAHALGCNAIIGVDFDYMTLDPQTANSTGGTTYYPYVFCVTANGNAVVIEKNSENKGTSTLLNDSITDNLKTELEETESELIDENGPKALLVDNMLICQGCDFVINDPDPDIRFCPQCGLEVVKA